MKIVIDRDIPFCEGLFEPYAEVAALDGRSISRRDVAGADVLVVRTRTRCDAALLAGSRVTTVVTATIGTDHIDTRWCAANGIEVFNAAGCNARGVLQWVAAVLARVLTSGGRRPDEVTLGVVGVGHVGSLVDEYARLWGFRTVCCDPPREEREHCGFLAADEVFAEADIVTLHVPLDASTFHMVDRRLLGLLRDKLLINSSRGEVVDSEALRASQARFALDVWEHEPDLDRELLHRALFATPHIAGYSLQGKANASARVAEVLSERFGLPLGGWYPPEVTPTTPQQISWEQMCASMGRHFDIEAESARLKSHPDSFEALRNDYRYRQEFF